MAKCTVCNTRKAKRTCVITHTMICPACCGVTRSKQSCGDCQFYRIPKRKYNEVPSYTPLEMQNDMDLQDYANAIEGSLVSFDLSTEGTIRDDLPIRVIELLLDTYYFHDETLDFNDELTEHAYHYVKEIIETDLPDIPTDTMIKVLGAIRFVAARRTMGGREYLDIIHQYVGERVSPGVRVMNIPRRPS